MILSNIFKQINNETCSISPKNMINWIEENQILSDIYDTKNFSTENIRSSETILNFYLDQGYLGNQEIEIFWKAMNLGLNTKHEMYEIYIKCSKKMTKEHKNIFLNKLKNEDTSEVNSTLVELVYKLGYCETSNSENTLIA